MCQFHFYKNSFENPYRYKPSKTSRRKIFSADDVTDCNSTLAFGKEWVLRHQAQKELLLLLYINKHNVFLMRFYTYINLIFLSRRTVIKWRTLTKFNLKSNVCTEDLNLVRTIMILSWRLNTRYAMLVKGGHLLVNYNIWSSKKVYFVFDNAEVLICFTYVFEQIFGWIVVRGDWTR